MKNLIRRISLIMCAIMLTFAVSACGKSDNDTKKNEPKTEDAATDDAKDDAKDEEDSSTPTGKFESLEDFVNSDIMQDQLETQLASLEGSGMSLELTADGDKLVYNFTIEDEALASALKADPSTLQSSLTSQAATFEAVASSLKAAVEVENPVVVVRYLDNAGAEIVAQEFAG